MKVTLLTCTRNRPIALEQCARFIRRSVRKPHQWIIINDGKPIKAPNAGVPTLVKNRLQGMGEPAHTLPLNLREFLPMLGKMASDDIVIFFEDDDWYSKDYINHVVSVFEANPNLLLYGQKYAKYYRLQAEEYATLPNGCHASLCATAFRASLQMQRVVELALSIEHDPFVDIRLWNIREIESDQKLLGCHEHCVGIKQMPGTPSTTLGWRGAEFFAKDTDSKKLIEWIGAEDAAIYRKIVKEIV